MKRAAHLPAFSLCLVAVAGSSAWAQQNEPSRARIFVNGAFSASSPKFSEARPYTLFVEDSTLNAAYEVKAGPGFEAGLQYRLLRHLGAAVSFASASRDQSMLVDTGLPHPFLFDQKRQVSGSSESLSYKESAIHFDLVYSGRSGSLEFAAFAGGSKFKVETDLVDRVEFSQTYPFDSATLTALPLKRLSDSPFGFNVGGSLDYVLGRNFGLGAQARFSRATAKLVPAEGASIDLEAGGFEVAAGLRIYF